MPKLIAYDKKGNYVDSITINNQEDINCFYEDFKMCKITEMI